MGTVSRPHRTMTSPFLNSSDNSLNLDKPSRKYIRLFVRCFFDDGAWDTLAEDLARPVFEALPPLKNGRKVFRRF